jgi:hypothetical protein
MMKSLRILALMGLAVALFAGSAEAQKKKTTKKSPAVKTSTTSTRTIAPLEVRAAREKVQIQKDNVTFYVQKLGPIGNALETLEPAYIEKRLNQQNRAKHEQRKTSFVATIRNIRQDLIMLEAEFRTKAGLQKYSTGLNGIADVTAEAEDLAIAGKFVQSNARLREVEKRLAETLVALPF